MICSSHQRSCFYPLIASAGLFLSLSFVEAKNSLCPDHLVWSKLTKTCMCDSGLGLYKPLPDGSCCLTKYQQPLVEDDASSCQCPFPLQQVHGRCLCPPKLPSTENYEPSEKGLCGATECDIPGQVRANDGKCSCPAGTLLTVPGDVRGCQSARCRADQILLPYLNICVCKKGMTPVGEQCVPECKPGQIPNADKTGCICIDGAEERPDKSGCDCVHGYKFDVDSTSCVKESTGENSQELICPRFSILSEDDESKDCFCKNELHWDYRNRRCACRSVAGLYEPFEDGSCCESEFMFPKREKHKNSCECVQPLAFDKYDCACKSTTFENVFYAPEPDGSCLQHPCPINGQLRDMYGSCACPKGSRLAMFDTQLYCKPVRCRDDQILIPVLDICACNAGMALAGDRCVPQCGENEERSADSSLCKCREGLIRDPVDSQCKLNCTNKGEIDIDGKCSCPKGMELLPEEGRCAVKCENGIIRDEHTGLCECNERNSSDPRNDRCRQGCIGQTRLSGHCVCGPNKEWSQVTQRCETKCPAFMTRNNEGGMCTCIGGYSFDPNKKKCVRYCSPGEAVDKNHCECAPGYEISLPSNQCVLSCPALMAKNDKSGECECMSGYMMWKGQCEQTCELPNSTRVQAGPKGCRCKAAFRYSWSRRECVRKCQSREWYDSDQGQCRCRSPYVRKNGNCHLRQKMLKRRTWPSTRGKF